MIGHTTQLQTQSCDNHQTKTTKAKNYNTIENMKVPKSSPNVGRAINIITITKQSC